MSDALTLDAFVSELGAANTPPAEQPPADSAPVDTAPDESAAEAIAEAEAPQDADAEAAAPEDGQPADAGPTDEAVIKWSTGSGESFEVPVAELKNGYMRDADYRQKTQALADERRSAQTQLQQQVQQIEAFAPEFGAVANLQAQVRQYENVNWQSLRQQDPAAYQALVADYSLAKDKLGQAQNGLQSKRQQWQQAQAGAFAQASREAAEHLSKLPGFKGNESLKSMRDYGLKSGFTADELAQVADKRTLEVLWKAQQWDSLQSKKPEVDNKVKALPPKAKPATAAPRTTKQEQVTKALQSRRSLSTDDFAALLKASR
jgi:hypothetical protein